MKKRIGFVSNSSSSSFIVVLPKKISELFKDKDIDMNKVNEFIKNHNKDEIDKNKILLADLIRILFKFEESGYYYQDDDYGHYGDDGGLPKHKFSITTEFFRQVLPELVLAQVETSSDRGSIELIDRSKIEKIYKMYPNEEKEV